MGLEWVRQNANVYGDERVVKLIEMRNGWKAYAIWSFAIGWSGGHGKDGFVPAHVLSVFRGDAKLMQMLVDVELMQPVDGGWQDPDWDQHGELAVVTARKARAKSLAGKKSQCIQRHGPDCGCWEVPDEGKLF